MQPHRQQPTSLPCPWDSPGKNTGVGYHFLLPCMKVKSESEVTQSCPTLGDPIDCSLPGSSIHGILQARVLEWGAMAFSNSMYTVKYTNIWVWWPFTCIHTHKPLSRSRYRTNPPPQKEHSLALFHLAPSKRLQLSNFFFYHKFFYFVLVLQINRISLSCENHPCILCSNLFFLLFIIIYKYTKINVPF